MNMEQHIRELRQMRLICREEGITDASLAEHFKCRVQSIFDILQGTTKEGELRENLFHLLTSKELLAPFLGHDDTPVQRDGLMPESEVVAEIKRLMENRGLSQTDLGIAIGQKVGSQISLLLNGKAARTFLYRVADYLGIQFQRDPAVKPRALPGARLVNDSTFHPPAPLLPKLDAPPLAAPERPPLSVVPIPAAADDVELLLAQAMAAEELAEALKDLALLRQAEKRHHTAVAVCRSVGLDFRPEYHRPAAA